MEREKKMERRIEISEREYEIRVILNFNRFWIRKYWFFHVGMHQAIDGKRSSFFVQFFLLWCLVKIAHASCHLYTGFCVYVHKIQAKLGDLEIYICNMMCALVVV